MRNELPVLPPVVLNGILEPVLGQIGVIANDDLELRRHLFATSRMSSYIRRTRQAALKAVVDGSPSREKVARYFLVPTP